MNRKPPSEKKGNQVCISLDDTDKRFLDSVKKITGQKPSALFMRALRKMYSRNSLEKDVMTNYAAFLTREIKSKKDMIAKLVEEIEDLEEEYTRITEGETNDQNSDVQSE